MSWQQEEMVHFYVSFEDYVLKYIEIPKMRQFILLIGHKATINLISILIGYINIPLINTLLFMPGVLKA